ncbi:MAG: hypothetical protein OER86_03905 [Phycisphaerae bacterium]|nr:hypothetical protein [Phycisphaerae bacterium]
MSDLAQSIPGLLGPGFKLLDAASTDGWRFWERRTLNSHRAVIYWRPRERSLSAEQIGEGVRAAVRAKLRKSWWRGLAFGVVLDLAELPDAADGMVDHVDTRNNSRGVWQWTIAGVSQLKLALGVHTWMAVSTTEIYRLLLFNLAENEGWSVGDFKKEKDKLMSFLTKAGGVGDSADYQPLSGEEG